MKLPSDNAVIERLLELGPFTDQGEALSAMHATLAAVGGALTQDERRAVAASLPTEAARLLLGAPEATCRSPGDIFQQVAARQKTAPSRAVEHVEIVCRALGELLSPTAHARLRHAVPEIAALFDARTESRVPPHGPLLGDALHDLAEGRLGGSRPLATANPAELAHRHSIARSDDPHAETKLSSACGLTQEREERSLATGRPGSRRPLSRRH